MKQANAPNNMRSSSNPFRQIRLLVFLTIALFLFLFTLAQNLELPNPVLDSIDSIPHYDKLGHFLLMGSLNFSLLLFLLPQWPSKRKQVLLVTTILVSILVGLEELSQAFFPHRTLSAFDYGASLLGIIVAAFLASSQRLRAPGN